MQDSTLLRPGKRASVLRSQLLLVVCLSLWLVSICTAADPQRNYQLGVNDQISIRSLHASEINDKAVRIDTSGSINLPLIGRVQIAGLTIQQAEAAISRQLVPYYRDVDVSVNVTEFKSQPVSVLGAVHMPGVYQMQGQKTLIELISLAGGFDVDAGYALKVTRRREYGPPSAGRIREEKDYYVSEVNTSALVAAKDPALNFSIEPNDVISVPRANLVYVVGEVKKAGGFPLREKENVSVLQALAMAEGLASTARPKNAKILRPGPDGQRRIELAVDLKRVLAGQDTDIPMQPDDILFVPNNPPKNAALKTLDTAIQMGTGVVIWGRF